MSCLSTFFESNLLQILPFHSFFCSSFTFILPFQDVLKGLVAVVGVKFDEEGSIEGIGVSNEAKHSHSHFS